MTKEQMKRGDKLYPRPDPRAAELEAQNARLTELNSQLCAKSNSYVIYNARLEEQIAALLVAIEAKQKALKMVEWEEYDDPDWGMQVFCPSCRMEKKHGHYECRLAKALALSPSTELLEARDRKRDAKLLREFGNKVTLFSSGEQMLEILAKDRESGRWNPEL